MIQKGLVASSTTSNPVWKCSLLKLAKECEDGLASTAFFATSAEPYALKWLLEPNGAPVVPPCSGAAKLYGLPVA